MAKHDAALSAGQKIVTFARGKMRQQVGRGECYDLADQALRRAGVKSAPDFGSVTDDADYVWGTEIDPKDAEAGDIVQFRDFTITTETVTVTRTTKKDGGWTETTKTSTETVDRPHHTAVVESNDGDGRLTILEQNVTPVGATKPLRKVQRNRMFWTGKTSRPPSVITRPADGSVVAVTKSLSVKVQGTVWVYRPEAR